MKKLFAAALLGAALGAHAAPATYGATSSLSGLGYRLIDLDEADGLAPSVAFRPRSVGVLTQAEVVGDAGTADILDVHWGPMTAFSGLSAPSALASAAALGGPSFSMLASGAAVRESRFNAFYAFAGAALDYVLGANTAIEWLGNYSLTAWSTPGRGLESFAGVVFGDSTHFQQAAASADQPFVPLSGEISYRVDHLGTGTLADTANFISVAGGGPLAPIPEPGTWALTLAGLAVVGWVTARRKS